MARCARGSRAALAKLFDSLAALPSARLDAEMAEEAATLRELGRLLAELNAYSETEVDEPDYDRRLDAYNRLPALIEVASAKLVLPLLCHCIHDVELDDIALKHSASHTIGLIVQRAAAERHAAAEVAAESREQSDEFEPLLSRVLMPALRRGLRLPPERDGLRQEMIRLLGATLLKVPSLQPEMAALLSPSEPEADFFANVTHIQMPRRQRALARLKQRVEAGALGTATLSGYLLPMLRHLVPRSSAKQALALTLALSPTLTLTLALALALTQVLRSSAKEADVAEEAVQTLREVASHLPWRPYLSSLTAFARLLKKQPSLEKRLVRVLVALLDVFHFEVTTEQIEAALLAKGVRGKDFSASRSGAIALAAALPAVANGSRPPASAADGGDGDGADEGAERGGDGEVLEGEGARSETQEEEGKQEAGKQGVSAMSHYADTKFCNLLLARELSRRWEQRVAVFVVSPGMVDTNLWRHFPAWYRAITWPVRVTALRSTADAAALS